MKGVRLTETQIKRIRILWHELNDPELIRERLGLPLRSIHKYKPDDVKKGGPNYHRRRYSQGD